MKQDFRQYTWSIATHGRHLHHYGIHHINYDTPLVKVSAAVKKYLEGPGKILRYRAMNQKLRTEHNILVLHHLNHNMMAELDPEGLKARNLQRKGKKAKGHFSSECVIWRVSLDGQDTLRGYRNSTFSLGVYGCIDTFSHKVLFLFVCYSNSNPIIVGRMYPQYLLETEVTETENGHNTCIPFEPA